MRRLYTLFILLFLSSMAFATEKEEIAKCAAKQSDADRLICFDELAKTLGVDRPETTITTGNGKWLVKVDQSPIDDSKNVYLILSADTEVRSRYKTVTPQLFVRCSENSTNVFIDWDTFLGTESTTMLSRLDSEKAETRNWHVSTDHEAVFYSGRDVEFAKKLMSHSKLLVQITPYSESPIMTTFSVEGLAEAIKPLRDACHW